MKLFWSFLRKRRKTRNEILLLLDLDNLKEEGRKASDPTNFSILDRLTIIMQEISAEVGIIVKAVAFAIPETINLHLEALHKMGITPRPCPIVYDKTRERINTTDPTLREYGETELARDPHLTHLCIGSGDQDFLPLVTEARNRYGLKIIILAPSVRALSKVMIDQAWRNQKTNKRAIYLIAPPSK